MIENIKGKLNLIFRGKFSVPGILLLISFITYGLLTPWMKFFHDEYSILLFDQRYNNVLQFFEGNRPFLGYIYIPLLTIFGSHYFLWFLFGVTTRWFHAVCLYYLIKEIWGDENFFPVCTSLLCLIFPAFQAQFAFIMFGILFLLFAFFLLSIQFSLMALKKNTKKTPLIVIALVFSLINLVTSEYFFTLEILRFLIIGFYLFNQTRDRWLKRWIFTSAPYLLLFAVLSIWRFSQQPAETAYAYNISAQISPASFESILNFLKKMIVDVWDVSIGAWIYAFYPSHLIKNLSGKVFFIFVFVSAFIGLISYFLIRNQRKNNRFSSYEHISIFLFSIAAIFFAGIPFWIANLPLGEFYMFSRWTVPFMPGICILFAWVLRFGSRGKFIHVICALLIAVGAGNQLLVANSFRHDWEKQQAYYWQFKWRIPGLKENTTIFSNMLDFDYENSDEISGALNFFYPIPEDKTIPIFQFYLPERVGTTLLPEIKEAIPLRGRRYYAAFHGNTSQSIIVDFQYPACFKVLDPEIDIYNTEIDELSKQALFLTDTALISDKEAELDSTQIKRIFGKQPDPDWCYYFEKAELARQIEEWDQIRSIHDTVKEKGLNPRDQREWFPFIESFAHDDEWDEAGSLTMKIYKQSPQYAHMLEALWDRIDKQSESSEKKDLILNDVRTFLDES